MHVIDRPSKYSRDYLIKLFQYTLGEDIGNAVSHIVGSFFGLSALITLTWVAARYGSWVDGIVFIFYGLSILFMFLMSALYHSMTNHTARSVFKKLDHISIYVLIVGSYAPYVFSLLKTQRAYIIFVIMTAVMIIGIIFKSLYVAKFKKTGTLIYLIMGWGSLYLLPQIINEIPKTGVIFMIVSGLTYTIGALLYAFGRFKFSHMVWHLFVIFGVVFMYISIAFFILQYR
jgi:hemolysin III